MGVQAMSTLETRVKKDQARVFLVNDLNGIHVVLECCPRNGDLTAPSQQDSVVHAYGLDENIYNRNRQTYTFYLNYFIVDGLVSNGGKLPITCHCCNSRY